VQPPPVREERRASDNADTRSRFLANPIQH
jgi:hypothetical protein